jgi:hypothetical protein
MQSFNHIHKQHKYKQSDRDISDNNNFFNVEHVFNNDEQKTSLFKIDHWDHDLLWKNNEIRFHFERKWKSFQKSSHRYLHELSNRDSRYLVSQETIWSISAANINSKNRILRSKNSHSLNFRLRWSFWQRSNRHNRQKNHWMKTIKSRSKFIDFRHN